MTREPRVDRRHQRHGDDERQHRARRVHHRRAHHHAHGAEVARGARHQVAGARALEVAEVEPLQVGEELVAQAVLEVARHADDDAARLEAEPAADGGQSARIPAA